MNILLKFIPVAFDTAWMLASLIHFNHNVIYAYGVHFVAAYIPSQESWV